MSSSKGALARATVWLCVAFSAGCNGQLGAGGGSNPLGLGGSAPDTLDASAVSPGETPDGSVTTPQVRQPVCGDGNRDDGEECDDGNRSNGDGCSRTCQDEPKPPRPPAVICGDSRLADGEEECDDGNVRPGDGCDRRCRIEVCGNERVDEGEDCDPPLAGTCDIACRGILFNCGDGELQEDEGEACDDGNEDRGDGCYQCRIECGDGILERDIGEECEPDFAAVGSCSAECKRFPVCGDGRVDESAGEDCDPSNGVSCVDCELLDVPSGKSDAGVSEQTCTPLSPKLPLDNPTFAADASGWLPANTKVALAHATDGANTPGSLQVTYTPQGSSVASLDGAVACIPVRSGTRYQMKVHYKNPSAGNPSTVKAFVSVRLHAGTQCEGTSVVIPGATFLDSRNTWLRNDRDIDTTLVGTADGDARLYVKMGAAVPAGVDAGTALFDDLEIVRVDDGPFCGDCAVDDASGEGCDDGNATNGDGCSSTCQIECGNGVDDGPLEECDDGNRWFGDGCTPSCKLETDCDSCALTACTAAVDACLNVDGVAQAGPGAGIPRNVLCGELRDCVHEAGCNGDTAIANAETLAGAGVEALENCYCGTSGVDCLDAGRANGACKLQVEAALESTDPVQLLQRFGGAVAAYPVFAAANDLLACEGTSCKNQCVAQLRCGDGRVQDRTRAFQNSYEFRIDGKREPCRDRYTATGAGCAFEECDDGNDQGGDGCDPNCFLESCGNYITQTGETCDDGNRQSGDGCDSSCLSEFECGDEIVSAPFEACDPADSGPVCSQIQFEEDPSQCGCDEQCAYRVCGNGIVQSGEDCDPPNGTTCNPSCQFTIDECSKCVLKLPSCGGPELLSGFDFPQYQVGCLDIPECFALWQCYTETGCHYKGSSSSPYGCYCGGDRDASVCFQGAAPVGLCKDEVIDAFVAQWGEPPLDAKQLATLWQSTDDGGFQPGTVPLAQANFLQQGCIGTKANFRTLLQSDTDLSEGEINSCVAACFVD